MRERNLRLQTGVAVFVAIAAIFFRITTLEAGLVIGAIALVMALELVNSALEKLTDIIKPRLHEQVETVKNMMAGAVLLSAIAAFFVGFIIFFPYAVEFIANAWYNTSV